MKGVFLPFYRKNYILKKNGTMEDDPERYIQTEIHSIHGSVGDSNLAFEECNETTNCCSDKYVVRRTIIIGIAQ